MTVVISTSVVNEPGQFVGLLELFGEAHLLPGIRCGREGSGYSKGGENRQLPIAEEASGGLTGLLEGWQHEFRCRSR